MAALKYRDIDVRGTVYPTVAAISAALSVHPVSVRNSIRRGHTHRIGLGLHGPEPMRIATPKGVFADSWAAAAAHGVVRSTVYNAVGRAREHNLGRGAVGGGYFKPVQIGTMTFPSRKAVDERFGFPTGFTSKALQHRKGLRWERLLSAVMGVQAADEAAARSLRTARENEGRVAA